MVRRFLYVAAGLAAFFVIAGIALPFLIDGNQFSSQIESATQEALNRSIRLGNIRVTPFSGGLTADDLEIGEDPAFGPGPFMLAKTVILSLDMIPLIFLRNVRVTGIEIDEPQVTVLRNSSGAWNFSSLGTRRQASLASTSADPAYSSAPLNPNVQHIEIRKGKLTVGDTGTSPTLRNYSNLELVASDLSYTTEFPFEASFETPGNGIVTLSGRVGPMNQTDASATRLRAGIEGDRLDLILAEPANSGPATSRIIDFAGTLDSDGQTLTSNGKLTATKLNLAPRVAAPGNPLTVDYEVNFPRGTQTRTAAPGDVRAGKTPGHISGSFSCGGATFVATKLLEPDAPVPELQSILPDVVSRCELSRP